MAQRLIRLLCPACKVSYEAGEVDRARLAEVLGDLPSSITLHQNKGCDKCGYTGFRGREGIYELLPISESVRSAIIAGKNAGSIAKLAFEESYRPLLHHGYQKVLEGTTTLSEVLRVTSLT
jgi:type II secretory ATPase GspE/PulE/Tfp pilus assembly ATPase PilB-like protein